MFARSRDGGLTWDPPVRINDDDSDEDYQWFGTMSVAPNGRIDAIWLDTRNAGSQALSFVPLLFLFDRSGADLVAERAVTDSFDPHVGWPQQDKMGDYFDMKSDNDSAHLAWANTFNGEQDVYYSVITPDIIGIEEFGAGGTVLNFSAFPNPFEDHLTLFYELASDENIKISLLNLYGTEIKILEEGRKPAGKYI